jgi:hypothetical protein
MAAPTNRVINCVVLAALVVVTPRASLVGKEAQTNGMHARHESARLFALNDSRFALFTYSVDDVPACLYVCKCFGYALW